MAATRANQVGTTDYTGGSLREDLANFISLVSAEKTPFISTLSTNKASNPKHEWQTDTLVDPAVNAQSGSFEFATANNVSDTPDRLNNLTQTFGKTVHVEGSLLRSDPAGAKNWFMYAVNKRKVEIRRDIERAALFYDFTGSAADILSSEASNVRKMGGLPGYATVINSLPTQGVEYNDNANAASGTITRTAGTAFSLYDTSALGASSRAIGSRVVQYTGAPTTVVLTIDHMNSMFRVASEHGGSFDTAQIPTHLKQSVSDLLIAGNGGAAQRRASEMSKRLNISVDSVMVEFGMDITLVHNYIMENHANDADHVIYFYDKDAVKRTVLNPYEMVEDKSARYGKGSILFCEETLEVSNPNSVGMIIGAS